MICLRLSSVVIYEPQTTLPRLELIYCPNRYIEEICRLQFASTRMNCTIQTLNVSWIGHWMWPKLSIFVIVWSLLDIVLVLADMSSTWIYRRGLITWTSRNTHICGPTASYLTWWRFWDLARQWIDVSKWRLHPPMRTQKQPAKIYTHVFCNLQQKHENSEFCIRTLLLCWQRQPCHLFRRSRQ